MTPDAVSPRRRGRPRATASEIEARRQKLLRAAYEVFLDKGYNATSIADITAHAGLGFGTYYKAFGSKRDILDPVIDYGVQQILGGILTDDLAATLQPAMEFDDQLRVIAGRIEAAFVARPRLAKFLVLEANTIDDAATARWYGLVDLAVSLVGDFLEHGVGNGAMRADLDVRATAQSVVGIILMAVVLGARHDTTEPGFMDAYIDAAIALINLGIRTTTRPDLPHRP